MNKTEVLELIRAHLDAGVDIDLPDDEIRRACKPDFDALNARLDALETKTKSESKIVRLDMIREAAKRVSNRRSAGRRVAA